jgi:hypothetical protein
MSIETAEDFKVVRIGRHSCQGSDFVHQRAADHNRNFQILPLRLSCDGMQTLPVRGAGHIKIFLVLCPIHTSGDAPVVDACVRLLANH